jgi:ribosomal protein S18 acetylase RimI-like enzyme
VLLNLKGIQEFQANSNMDSPSLSKVIIRSEIHPGDIGYITYLHGKLYSEEYGYGIGFEAYVAKGLAEFCEQYDPVSNRIWVCEHNGKIVGFLALVNRGDTAQLRYFILLPEYRGMGLGSKLMNLYMTFLRERGYKKSYLLTTDELHAAARLYTRHGFKIIERKKSTAFGKEVTEVLYEWRAE